MKILIQHHSLVEMARILGINLKDLGKTKYSHQIKSIFDRFDSCYLPILSLSALNTLLDLQRDLEVLNRVKASDKIDDELIKMIERIEEELDRIIQIQQTHEEIRRTEKS
jgi:hypothetical protein